MEHRNEVFLAGSHGRGGGDYLAMPENEGLGIGGGIDDERARSNVESKADGPSSL